VEGIVFKSTGSWYAVRSTDGKFYNCKLKGQFRIKGLKATNPVAVGDYVSFELSDTIGIINKIEERKNYIIRKSKKLSKQVHIIASNIDMAYLVVTLAQPRTSTGFIDRFLITAEAYHIPASLIFNKSDIYNEKQLDELGKIQTLYSTIGYPVYKVSAKTGFGVDFLKEHLRNKVNLFSGHSGVGKSALINAIDPAQQRKTGEISEYYLKGKHTTTFAEMLSLDNDGFIIDTPGIKELGLIDFKKEDLCHYFPEIFKHLHNCKFYNCTHINEPGCAVKEALSRGDISYSRYKNYTGIFFGEDVDVCEWE
jgi:ribosome biogenesis GTPase